MIFEPQQSRLLTVAKGRTVFGYFSLINREIDQCDRSKECIKKKFETIDFTTLLYNKGSIVYNQKNVKRSNYFH